MCRVSEATVSFVINGKRTLRADTRERVLRAMREMNYNPSAVARGLSSKRVHTLGILFGAIASIEFAANSYISELLQGIIRRAQQLTTIRQPLGEIGETAIGILIERLRKPESTRPRRCCNPN